MIDSRIQPATIAERLGHSVAELFKSYAGAFAKLQLSGDSDFQKLMEGRSEVEEEEQ